MKLGRATPQAAPVSLLAGRRLSLLIGDYIALTKPRLNLLVVVTSAAGYYLGAIPAPEWTPLLQAASGTALVAAGAAVPNQLYERDTDAVMRRTRNRPIPDGRIRPEEATFFGLGLAAAGLALLFVTTNLLATSAAVATLVVYVLIYTPLKRRSALATLVGAVPGALPPLIGWAASHGSLSPGGWTLFAIVFLWQIPHFMAISWLYRDDYTRAGFPMLAVTHPDGRRVGREALVYSLALLPVSLLPTALGVAGSAYIAIAVPLGAAMVWLAARFAARGDETSARWLFMASITYLPLVWMAMILTH